MTAQQIIRDLEKFVNARRKAYQAAYQQGLINKSLRYLTPIHRITEAVKVARIQRKTLVGAARLVIKHEEDILALMPPCRSTSPSMITIRQNAFDLLEQCKIINEHHEETQSKNKAAQSATYFQARRHQA